MILYHSPCLSSLAEGLSVTIEDLEQHNVALTWMRLLGATVI